MAEDAAFAKFVIDQVMDSSARPRPRLLAGMNTLRLNLAELGLKPDRADKTPSLEQYLASRESAVRSRRHIGVGAESRERMHRCSVCAQPSMEREEGGGDDRITSLIGSIEGAAA